jgi:DNA-binding CsgD family transcriptional regulator
MLQPSSFDRAGGVDRIVLPEQPEEPGDARERRVRARAGIAAVDALLEVLEQRRDGAAEEVEAEVLLQWLGEVEGSGLVVPVAVSGATTAVELNESLLDWQEELLDTAYPRRTIPLRGKHLDTPPVEPSEAAAWFGDGPQGVSGDVNRMAGGESPTTAGGRVSPGSLAAHTHRHRWHQPARRSALWSARPSIRLAVVAEPAAPSRAETVRDGRDPNGLTEREVTVLRVVAEGLTNAQVAKRLHLSEHTVAAHLRSIFRKTDVASRSAATRYALEHGLT